MKRKYSRELYIKKNGIKTSKYISLDIFRINSLKTKNKYFGEKKFRRTILITSFIALCNALRFILFANILSVEDNVRHKFFITHQKILKAILDVDLI